MMKKVLLLFAGLALMVSCTKNVEFEEEGKTNPEVKPKESTVEITLNTIASPTKAIAEGTDVPTDNEIRFYPRFFSDISSADYSSYNDIFNFGYDAERRVWRNYKGRIFGGRNLFNYNFTPLYWPAGERVFMDYVACSFSNYVYSQNTEANNVLMVEPIKKNPNRMDVNYEFSYLTRPFASSMLLTTTELQEMQKQVVEMRQMGYITLAEIAELSDLVIAKYDEAVKLAQNEITIDDDYLASDARALEGDTPEAIQADATNTLNLAYWFFMNYAPRIYRFMQDDLLYSHDRSLRDINHGEVKAVFNHSKAWVKVIVNNQTANDLFISGIRFDDVKSGGTLIIDNSKSAFEAYWDFPEEVAATGAKIDPYTEVSLDGNSSPVVINPENMDVVNAVRSAMPQQVVKGMLPDQYIIPTGCYGPALAVDKVLDGEEGPIQALNCTYLDGRQRFDLGDNACRTMVAKLGGMMFPAQEPGMITLRYTFWKKYLRNTGGTASNPSYLLPMNTAVGLFDTFTPEDTREISLNLPRQTWQMGKVYVYVLTIAENEITINPYVTEWEETEPIFYPGGEEEPAEEGNGQTEEFGNNYKNPGWWE